MKLQFKNNFWGYFTFYYSVLGYRIFIYLFLSIFISFLDGVGLAMFMPLLQAVGDGQADAGKQSMGQLHYLTDGIKSLGLPLNLNTVLGVLVVLFILKGLIKFVQMNYLVKLKFLFIRKVRYNLINDLKNLSYTGFLKLDAGRVQNTLTGEVQRLYLTMNNYFGAAQSVGMLATYIALAVLANYQFALLVAVGAGLSNVLYRKIYKETKIASHELSKKGHNFNSFLVQAIINFKYLKATNYFSSYIKKLKLVISDAEKLNKKIGFLNAITSSVKEPLIIIVVALVIILQVNLMGASLSSIILSLLLFYRALGFLMVIQNQWQSFIHNSGGMSSVAEMFKEMNEMREKQGNIVFERIKTGIKLENVTFAYGENKVLNGVDINLPKNSTIAFIGESGSGKTTLANLICGLMQPLSGNLYIDDEPIQAYSLDSYRSKIGYISQEAVIFNDNIFNNITFWADFDETNKKHFNKVTQLASLSNYIEEQADKEFTKLGDNGALVSGGQKQRISIARELYKNAEVLIFDEATSALDSETERIIQDNIEQLKGHYTIVLIAHRLSTIKEADVIYLLDKGKVTASGNFQELYNTSEKFKRMVALQEFS